MTKVRTLTRGLLDLKNPNPKDIDTQSMFVGVSREQRYANQLPLYQVYSVAEHTVIGTCVMTEKYGVGSLEAKAFFCHDLSEAYLRDIPSPIKPLLPEYQILEKNLTFAIWKRMGLLDIALLKCNPETLGEKVKAVDQYMGRIESEFFFEGTQPDLSPDVEGHLIDLCCTAHKVSTIETQVYVEMRPDHAPIKPEYPVPGDLFGNLTTRKATALLYACYMENFDDSSID